MKASLLTAGVLAAAVMAGAGRATAADLDYGRVPPPDRYSSAYEDPRYRDIYGAEPRNYSHEQRYYKVQPPHYGHPVPPAPVYRDHAPPPRHYSEGPDAWRYGNGCISKDEAKRRLTGEGWRDFHDLELRQNVAKIKARRPNGDLYDLKIDRCTGEIVNAQPLERAGPGPYAYENGPRRFEPYYR